MFSAAKTACSVPQRPHVQCSADHLFSAANTSTVLQTHVQCFKDHMFSAANTCSVLRKPHVQYHKDHMFSVAKTTCSVPRTQVQCRKHMFSASKTTCSVPQRPHVQLPQRPCVKPNVQCHKDHFSVPHMVSYAGILKTFQHSLV